MIVFSCNSLAIVFQFYDPAVFNFQGADLCGKIEYDSRKIFIYADIA